MTAASKLRSVAAPAPATRYTIRPEFAYPGNAALQASYVAAVAWMRSRPRSIFTLDPGARRPPWCASPTQEQA